MDINFSWHYLLRAGLMYRLSTFVGNQLTINTWVLFTSSSLAPLACALWLLLFQRHTVNSYYIVLEHILNASKFILFAWSYLVIWHALGFPTRFWNVIDSLAGIGLGLRTALCSKSS